MLPSVRRYKSVSRVQQLLSLQNRIACIAEQFSIDERKLSDVFKIQSSQTECTMNKKQGNNIVFLNISFTIFC